MLFRPFHLRMLLVMMMILHNYEDLLHRHPSSPCPDVSVLPSKPALTVDDSMVLSCLRAFPKGTKPGASKLRAQHLLDVIAGSTAPAARDCLLSLTCLMNHLLSGKAPSCLSPWLCGAPLTALLKKGGGVRPIAVGEVFRRLASRLCCLAVRPSLPSVFYPLRSSGGWNSWGVGDCYPRYSSLYLPACF